MEVLRNGKFTITLSDRDLARGLRSSSRLTRDRHGMTELVSMVGQDGTLSTLPKIEPIDTSAITDPFPYPQIFVLSNYILVCDSTHVYEWVDDALVTRYTASIAASTWKVVDFIEFLILTNNDVVVVRDAHSGEFSETTDIPKASAICNYNGQIVLGGPGELS